ncbi:hypothetical protein H0E84_15020 [Luteimonas sp. SJ-92]|uniref:Uncharacterized protein n=1 Tax=Luteimonas salinisoli TaxID=2752307 RepID=A0A853JED1_9GAMM|nr:hypothetical protein [Luteimonas salinisoli]NZA27691.1 hypothetical protein [Luteimonas salinisoli]
MIHAAKERARPCFADNVLEIPPDEVSAWLKQSAKSQFGLLAAPATADYQSAKHQREKN